MIFLRKLQLWVAVIVLFAAGPAAARAESQFGWTVEKVRSWQSPDSVVSVALDEAQVATVAPQFVPDLPAPWQPLTAAYTLATDSPLASLTLRPATLPSSYTAILVQLPDGTWQELKSSLGSNGQRTVSRPGSATVVLASRPDWQQGIASWYKYKGCPCAASTVYPKGTKLVVTRADVADKSVVVTVNDYGPEAWTKRTIDLDVTAFKALGNKRAGVMTVTVKPL
jgi:hypothetical protein